MSDSAALDIPEDGKLAHNIVHFARALRKAGLPVGPGRVLDAVRAVQAAGFTDIHFERLDAKVLVGCNVEEAIAFQLALGPAGETFREAGALGHARRVEVEAALSEMFDQVEHDDEGLWMDSSSWLITARNPAD